MQPQQKPSRPTGVTVLAAVALVGGVFGLLGGITALSGATIESPILGAVVVVFAILGLVLGIGFLQGRSWAWTVGVVVYILSVPLGGWEIVSASIIGGSIRVIVGFIILYYLTRPSVKSFFGKGAAPTPSSA